MTQYMNSPYEKPTSQSFSHNSSRNFMDDYLELQFMQQQGAYWPSAQSMITPTEQQQQQQQWQQQQASSLYNLLNNDPQQIQRFANNMPSSSNAYQGQSFSNGQSTQSGQIAAENANNGVALEQISQCLLGQLQNLGINNNGSESRGNQMLGNLQKSVTQQQDVNNIKNSRAGPRIFVGKLSKEVNEDDVKDCFSKFGFVLDVYLPKNKDNKLEHRGFGFVTFETEAAVQRVVAHQPHKLKGQQLAIDVAIPRKEDVQGDDLYGLVPVSEQGNPAENVYNQYSYDQNQGAQWQRQQLQKGMVPNNYPQQVGTSRQNQGSYTSQGAYMNYLNNRSAVAQQQSRSFTVQPNQFVRGGRNQGNSFTNNKPPVSQNPGSAQNSFVQQTRNGASNGMGVNNGSNANKGMGGNSGVGSSRVQSLKPPTMNRQGTNGQGINGQVGGQSDMPDMSGYSSLQNNSQSIPENNLYKGQNNYNVTNQGSLRNLGGLSNGANGSMNNQLLPRAGGAGTGSYESSFTSSTSRFNQQNINNQSEALSSSYPFYQQQQVQNFLGGRSSGVNQVNFQNYYPNNGLMAMGNSVSPPNSGTPYGSFTNNLLQLQSDQLMNQDNLPQRY